jgi:hypothetical protein
LGGSSRGRRDATSPAAAGGSVARFPAGAVTPTAEAAAGCAGVRVARAHSIRPSAAAFPPGGGARSRRRHGSAVSWDRSGGLGFAGRHGGRPDGE